MINNLLHEINWNPLQLLAWVCTKDPLLIETCSSNTQTEYHYEEHVLPDGRKEMIQVQSPPPCILNISCHDTYSVPIIDAQKEIMHLLQKGTLIATGKKNNRGDRILIPKELWADLQLYLGDSNINQHCASYRGIPDGSSSWYNILFTVEDVLRIWPDSINIPEEPYQQSQSTNDSSPANSLSSSSYPGRPSIMNAIKEQMHKRASEGKLELTLAEEARKLMDWVEREYPGVQTPQEKSLENGIRESYKKLKNQLSQMSAQGKSS